MLLELSCLLFVVALCCAAEAESPLLGMGRRHHFGEGRLDIAYTTDLPTPHVDWADPYVGGPLSALVVPSVTEGRTLVELMQRLSMKVDAVTIDPSWDVNKWTMSFGKAYGARSEQAADGSVDYSLVYRYLQEDLESDRRWEVMLTHGILGWGHLPEAIRSSILRRVNRGLGLVLVGPYAGPADHGLDALSPLVPAVDESAPEATTPPRGPGHPGAWSAEEPHYITRGVPLTALPRDHLKHRRFRVTDGATVLATAGSDPVVAVKQVGKGRVVALGHESLGLAPLLRWSAYGEIGDAWWETWYSLMIRALIWAARKEPSAAVDRVDFSHAAVSTGAQAPLKAAVRLSGTLPKSARVRWQVRDDAGDIECQGSAALQRNRAALSLPVSDLPGGKHLLDVFLLAGRKRIDWASASFEVRSPVRLRDLTVRPAVIEKGRTARATVALNRSLPKGVTLSVEMVDNYHRVIARDHSPRLSSDRRQATARLATDDLLTNIGWVRASLHQDDRLLHQAQTRVAFATPPEQRVWDDYEVNVPFYGPHSYYHWMDLLDEQYRRAGITWLMQPERNYRFSVIARPDGLGVYYYDRKPFEEQMQAYWDTGDRKHLRRRPCLHGDWRKQARRQISRALKPYRKYRPFHYYVYDEPSLTSYTRAFEFCYTDETLAAFRDWLRSHYGTLRALNLEWGTSYKQWRQVQPPTAEEARREGTIPAWADFRHFMDLTFADAFHYTQQVVDELDPGALTLVGGTQQCTPFNGSDWWLLSDAFGILEPYFGIEQLRSFNPDLPIIQACGYQDAGPELEDELWRRALQGQRGATIFWNFTLHDPDLMLNSQGEAMARAFGQLRGQGLARLLCAAQRDHSRIAILHSQMSLYAAWIQDGDLPSGKSQAADRFAVSQQAWPRLLHQLGLHFHWISYQQLAEEGLDRKQFDLLVLPHTLSLSESETRAIRRFAKAGGTVLADGSPGRFDGHCKPRSRLPLAAAKQVHSIDAPLDTVEEFLSAVQPWIQPLLRTAGVKPAARVTGASPQIVRYLHGEASYIGLVDAPDQAHTVKFDRPAHIYDVRRRRYLTRADHLDVEKGQGGVALYALLPSRVESMSVTCAPQVPRGDAVAYQVTAHAGPESVARVFAIRVYGPDGQLRHMYQTNVDAPAATAAASFRLALNDPLGEWRLVAADAATGVTGETSFRVV